MLHRCKLCMLSQSSATETRAVALNPTDLLILSARSISYQRFSLDLRYYFPEILHQVSKMPSQTPTAGCRYTNEICYHPAAPKLKMSPSKVPPCIKIPRRKMTDFDTQSAIYLVLERKLTSPNINFTKALKYSHGPTNKDILFFPAY